MTGFYVTTQDDKGKAHNYKATNHRDIMAILTDPAEAVTSVKPASQFRLSSLLSPSSLAAIKSVR